PVQQAQAELPGCLQVAGPLGRVHTDHRPEPVVVLRPVHDRHVAAGKPLREVGLVQDPTKRPPWTIVVGVEEHLSLWLVRFWRERGPAQERPRPSGWLVLPPQGVLPGAVDGVVLTG